MFFGTFVGQSNVLRLIKVFIVTNLAIHTFLTICLDLPKFMQFAVCYGFMDGWMDVWMDVWMHACMHACLSVSVSVSVCVCVCVYVCMYMCICIYVYIGNI